MSLTYQSPESVLLGNTYNAEVFVLKNTWNLEEVDLDKKLEQNGTRKTASANQTPDK